MAAALAVPAMVPVKPPAFLARFRVSMRADWHVGHKTVVASDPEGRAEKWFS
jgi:hypothetical protein